MSLIHNVTILVTYGEVIRTKSGMSFITRFIDSERITNTKYFIDRVDDNDKAFIINLMEETFVYESIRDEINRGWSGKYLCIYLTKNNLDEAMLDLDLLSSLEDGILMLKDKPAIVWNSQNVFIFTPNPSIFFNYLRNDKSRKISPRAVQMEQ